MQQPLIYDAASILGLGPTSNDPLPLPGPDEVVIRVGAWSLMDLRTCATVVVDQLMLESTWYDRHHWSSVKLTPAIYRVRLFIPDSNRKNLAEQSKLLLSEEDVAPVALAAAVRLCHLKQTGKDLLDRGWTRCAEELLHGDHAILIMNRGRVHLYSYYDGFREDFLWLAGCRKES